MRPPRCPCLVCYTVNNSVALLEVLKCETHARVSYKGYDSRHMALSLSHMSCVKHDHLYKQHDAALFAKHMYVLIELSVLNKCMCI